ncbi:MAG: glycosyltransferase family 4 protein [Bacteroidales bacterium]|nr:glycosyltransferase family 4 protein [Bacteroidales bacterium]
MKIGFDAKRAFCNATGLGNYSRMVIGGIAAAHPEDELLLFTPRREGRYANLFRHYSNVRVVEPEGWLWRLMPALWRSLAIGKLVRREGVEVYHGLSHELPMGMPATVRQVVTMHDLIVWRYPRQYGFVDRLVYKRKMRSACRRADKVVAVSAQTARDLQRFLEVPESKVELIYQSCDTQFYQPVDAAQRQQVRTRYRLPSQYLICVGTIEQRKNQEAVMRAMALLPTDVSLVVVGRKTRYSRKVYDTVCRMHLEHRVLFLDNVQPGDLPALYAEARASLYMSHFEGFGIPVLESLCCGTPVVAARRASLPEVGGNAALYADPDNADDIARQVKRLLTNPTLCEQLAVASQQRAQSFAAPAIVEQFHALYAQLPEA